MWKACVGLKGHVFVISAVEDSKDIVSFEFVRWVTMPIGQRRIRLKASRTSTSPAEYHVRHQTRPRSTLRRALRRLQQAGQANQPQFKAKIVFKKALPEPVKSKKALIEAT